MNYQFKVAAIASVGALFECYDFMICAFLASYLIKIFFSGNTFLGIFTIFTVAFISRPIGGMFWAHLGDRHGRKIVFSLTMLLLVVPTLLIAVFPINLSQNLNLYGFMLLRFLQGFLVGGEFPGGITFIAEISSSKRRATLVSIFIASLTGGTLLASVVSLLTVTIFNSEQVLLWAWRIPFILSVVLVFVAIYIRKMVQETPYFISLTEHKAVSKFPIIELITHYPRDIFCGIIIVCCSAFGLTTFYTFFPSLMKISAIFSEKQIFNLTTFGTLLVCLFNPVAGILADRIGRKVVFLSSVFLLLLCFGLFYIAIIQKSFVLLAIAMFAVSIIYSGINGLYCVILSELFPTQIRFSGVALCFTIAFSLCGGLLPIIYLSFAALTKTFILPAIIFVILLCITFLMLYNLHDMKGRDLLI